MTQYQPGQDVSLDAGIRTLLLKGFGQRLTDSQWIECAKLFKFNAFDFDIFQKIAAKTPGYNQEGLFKAWNSIKGNGDQPPSIRGIIGAARKADKEQFNTFRRILSGEQEINTEGLRKADKIAWHLRQYKIEYNQLRDVPVLNGEMLTDTLFAQVHYDMMNQGISSKQALETVILTLAQQSKFHPIKQYLTRVKGAYDGSDQIGLLTRYFDDVDDVFGLYIRKWLIGAVGKVLGEMQNPMLVLMGPQNAGKGYFAQWLCPLKELFISSPILPENKDHMLRACDRWIWEVAELGNTTRKADLEALKAFLTQVIFTVRRPYGHFDLDKRTTASFIGTINDDGAGFLNDVTGNRRYRPVTLTHIDRDYVKQVNLDLLWGQAVSLFKSGETIELGEEDSIILNTHILKKYKRENPMEDLLTEWFVQDDESLLSTTEILAYLQELGWKGRNTDYDSKPLANIMKLLGWGKVRTGNKRGYHCRYIGGHRVLTPESPDYW